MNRITKLFQTKATSIDETNKTIKFKISDDQPDRMGESVDQGSWNFKEYLKNPIVLWGHNPDEPENVLGTTVSLDVQGSETYATVTLDEDINPKAELVWKQLLRGTLRCVSVGFINHTFEVEEDQPVLKDNELLEISIVPIPANPRAIALSYKEGQISQKDATWLMESMRKEASLLEEQLSKTEKRDKAMSPEQEEKLNAVFDAVTKLTQVVEDQKTETDAKLADLAEQLKPAEETDEEKEAREAQEAADAKKAEEDANVAAGLNPDGSAKGGDDDQPGAGDDEEFDENAELTPEQEAALDQQFQEQLAELEAAA